MTKKKSLASLWPGLIKSSIRPKARIESDEIWVTSDKVKEPIAVRYAWQDSPIANLQNKEGMPAGTFRSDIWELQTQARITTPLVLKQWNPREASCI